jgi:hypothetical protein
MAMKVLLGPFCIVQPILQPYPNCEVIRSVLSHLYESLIPELCILADGSSGSNVGAEHNLRIHCSLIWNSGGIAETRILFGY